jgi:hypothetical protein
VSILAKVSSSSASSEIESKLRCAETMRSAARWRRRAADMAEAAYHASLNSWRSMVPLLSVSMTLNRAPRFM